jgi:Arc/MetJ-type ribon-helix-helix transcriptional regulator
MGERVITLKLPASLVHSLKERTHKDHYLDLSEQVRSIVRQACLRSAQPYSDEIARLREDILEHAQRGATLTREQVLQELTRMLREGAR